MAKHVLSSVLADSLDAQLFFIPALRDAVGWRALRRSRWQDAHSAGSGAVSHDLDDAVRAKLTIARIGQPCVRRQAERVARAFTVAGGCVVMARRKHLDAHQKKRKERMQLAATKSIDCSGSIVPLRKLSS